MEIIARFTSPKEALLCFLKAVAEGGSFHARHMLEITKDYTDESFQCLCGNTRRLFDMVVGAYDAAYLEAGGAASVGPSPNPINLEVQGHYATLRYVTSNDTTIKMMYLGEDVNVFYVQIAGNTESVIRRAKKGCDASVWTNQGYTGDGWPHAPMHYRQGGREEAQEKGQ